VRGFFESQSVARLSKKTTPPLALPRGCSLSSTRERARVRVFSSRKALRHFPSQPRNSIPVLQLQSHRTRFDALRRPSPWPSPRWRVRHGERGRTLGFAKGLFPLLYSGEGQGEGLFEPQSFATLSKKNGHPNPATPSLFCNPVLIARVSTLCINPSPWPSPRWRVRHGARGRTPWLRQGVVPSPVLGRGPG
jgi:hypothetical protein